jgi:predicted phage terminase large subunit-like protein
VLGQWCPHAPTERQQAFLDFDCREALYGGAAAGGKTDALLMSALQYVDTPGYAAILFRRTYPDLALPGAIMDRANDWLSGRGAHWNDAQHTWAFPSGATLTFGYMDTERVKYRYQSAEFQFVGFDELTQFPETQYRYLFSRLRRLEGVQIPLRMRAASNPGGLGHDWVKARFVLPHDALDRVFVPAKLTDNPYIDEEEYRKALGELDSVTLAQLLEGNWDVLPQGNRFKREWFHTISERPAFLTSWVRYWDKAGTEGAGDWSAGVLVGRAGQLFYVLDVVRGQWSAAKRNEVMLTTTRMDARVCPRYEVWAEQEPGSGGKESAEATIANLVGYSVHAETVTGSKTVRANPFAAQCEAGNVMLIEGAWNSAYIEELCAFPDGPHDDQVDASSGGFAKLATIEYEQGVVEYA